MFTCCPFSPLVSLLPSPIRHIRYLLKPKHLLTTVSENQKQEELFVELFGEGEGPPNPSSSSEASTIVEECLPARKFPFLFLSVLHTIRLKLHLLLSITSRIGGTIFRGHESWCLRLNPALRFVSLFFGLDPR